ncbi:hypothetical protein ACWEV3_08955 [Saccharopolyspora sp. NPDC003752]
MAKHDTAMRNFASALNQMPDHHGTVHRGIDIPANKLDEFLTRYAPGAEVEERGFTTTKI